VASPFIGANPAAGQSVQNFLTNQAAKAGLPAELLSGILRGPLSQPSTRTRLSHAYTLRIRGAAVGAVYRASVRQAREVAMKREMYRDAHGEPADLVPGVMSTQSFSIARYDLHSSTIEDVFGGNFEIEMLMQQASGFRIREFWRSPTGFINSNGRKFEYAPVFLTDIGREANAETPDRIVRVNAELVWLERYRVS
jgi:hypothetical protein